MIRLKLGLIASTRCTQAFNHLEELRVSALVEGRTRLYRAANPFPLFIITGRKQWRLSAHFQ